MKNLVLLCGLPNSGMEIISGALVNHPGISVVKSSRLAAAIENVVEVFNGGIPGAGLTPLQRENAIVGLVSGAYSTTTAKYIVDVDSNWIRAINPLSAATNIRPKIIYTVRDIPGILAEEVSKLGIAGRNCNAVDLQLEISRQVPTTAGRCSIIFEKLIRPELTNLADICSRSDFEVLFVEYRDLCGSLQETLNSVCDFIGCRRSGIISTKFPPREALDAVDYLQQDIINQYSAGDFQPWLNYSGQQRGTGWILGSKEFKLEGDSLDYDLLYRAAVTACRIPGLFCEIGVRRGGSLKWIIDAASQNSPGRTILGIDPYGNIEYNATQEFRGRLDYTNAMKDESLPQIYGYASSNGVNLIFINLEDTEFFSRYHDGVPVYDNHKSIENRYAFVFFDGPHDLDSINIELDFFLQRTNTGAVFVFDDIASYPHHEVHSRLLSAGFTQIEVGSKGRKISYICG